MSALRRSKHAVYDLKYHFVWIPKYRKGLLTEEVAVGKLRKLAHGPVLFGDGINILK